MHLGSPCLRFPDAQCAAQTTRAASAPLRRGAAAAWLLACCYNTVRVFNGRCWSDKVLVAGRAFDLPGDERSRERIRISVRSPPPPPLLLLATLMAHWRAACCLLDLNRGMNAMFLNSDEDCVDRSPSDLRQYLERWTASAEGTSSRSPIKCNWLEVSTATWSTYNYANTPGRALRHCRRLASRSPRQVVVP